uniref:PH domain-containing protein n=1 Tax=Macrostomum lignano TaxID=282301 RepID=A0A1I8F6L3_9PLAT
GYPVKNWLVHKKRKVEPAPRRTWRQYWVCLKGSVLLFYKSCEQEPAEKPVARHSLIIEGCIVQALPEHPKREYVFSLSTAFGDAFMLQAPDGAELDSWVTALHTACASLFARQHGKSDTVKLLKSEIAKLECSIDLVS